jgi:hypothetical protein
MASMAPHQSSLCAPLCISRSKLRANLTLDHVSASLRVVLYRRSYWVCIWKLVMPLQRDGIVEVRTRFRPSSFRPHRHLGAILSVGVACKCKCQNLFRRSCRRHLSLATISRRIR